MMAKPRHLAHAPILEAVLDIHVVPRPGATFVDLQKAYEPIDFGYRQQAFLLTGMVGFTVNLEAEVHPQHGAAEKIGLRLQSADEKYVALVRTNGLTVSRQAPYEDWEKLEAETRRLWDIYVKRWEPNTVTRVAARYINNLRLPMKLGQSFSDFIITVTELPGALPQSLGSFLQQFDCADRPTPTDNRARITLAWNGAMEGDLCPLILDIDAYRAGLSLAPSDASIWTILGDLRALKNRCFFGLLTEQAVKEYE
jgi:uncharacterized protein (TIGR04255 family)